MRWEAWGTPPDRQEPPQRCPVCDGEWHAEGCVLGQEVARRLQAEDAQAAMRSALEDECDRTDSLLTILGLPAERCRTEGGSLVPHKALTLMAEAGHPPRFSERDCELLGNGLAYIIREYPERADHARALLQRLGPNV